MRICIFSTTFYPQTGGAEHFIHYLATSLSALNLEVFVLVPQTKELKSFKHDYKLLKIYGARFSSTTILFFNLLCYQLIYRFDIIQAVILYPPGHVAIKLRRFFKKLRIYCRPTGSDIQTMPEIEYGLRLDWQIDKKIRESLNHFDGLVANSRSIKEELINAGCREKKIKVISNGLDLKRFDKKPVDVRETFSLPKDSKVLLSVGRVHPKKNYETLIKAMKIVVERCPNCYCVIVGGGEGKLKDIIEKANIKDRVILAGQLLGEELTDSFLTSDIFVFPSLIEGQPNVLLEAMAAGLPVVASNVAGNRDVVIKDETGFLVGVKDPQAFGEKILYLLNSPDTCERFSRRAKIEAEKYSWEKVGSDYLEFYGHNFIP